MWKNRSVRDDTELAYISHILRRLKLWVLCTVLTVAGCGKRETYVVVGPDGGDGWFAAEGSGTAVKQ